MTADEIDKLDAGPELDMLVAGTVMGWERNADGNKSSPSPSTDIAAAWDVVEITNFAFCLIRQDGMFYIYDGWRSYEDGAALAWAPTAPLAICKAALKAAQS